MTARHSKFDFRVIGFQVPYGPVFDGRSHRIPALLFAMSFLLCFPAFAQNRPLQTPDAEVVPAGTLRAEVGFDFLQDVEYPATGLSGDLTSLGDVEMRMGVGRIVEVDLEGVIQNFLDVKKQSPTMIPLHLTGEGSTHDVGDFSLYTKILLVSEQKHRPAFAFRFGFQMPNSDQARGIGLNTTNVFASFIVQKHFGKLNTWGEAGIGILQAPQANFSQNDVLIYGGAFTYPLSQRISLAGEINGRYNSRHIDTGLLGTESRSEARFGVQIFAGGFQWDLAGVAGLTSRDPSTGFTLGVTRDIKLFSLGPKQ